MYTRVLLEMFSNVKSLLVGADTASKVASQQTINDLAQEIMEYGRMLQDDYPGHKISVNIAEVGRRFREERSTVVRALVLLRKQGKAEPGRRSDTWRLRV